MSSVELMNRELDFLDREIPSSIEHHDWTHEVFPEELREIYDPEEVIIRRYDSIEDLVGNVINPQSFSDLPLNNPRSFTGFVNFLDLAKRLGAELFGFYLPYHKFHRSRRWGIYLMKEPILEHCNFLYHSQEEFLGKEALSYEEVHQIFIYCIFRHETFHYQVETFVTRMELIQNKALYLPFQSDVEPLVMNSKHWLEEALAESSVVRSRYVSNKNKGVKAKHIIAMYEWHLKMMPPGYSDYQCHEYGGPDEAHMYFASQLKETARVPEAILPKSMTVKSLNLHDFSSVPTYWVSSERMKQIY